MREGRLMNESGGGGVRGLRVSRTDGGRAGVDVSKYGYEPTGPRRDGS